MIDIKDAAPMPTEEDLINALFGVHDQLCELIAEGKEKEARELELLLVDCTSTMQQHPSRVTQGGEFQYEGPCFCHECVSYSS